MENPAFSKADKSIYDYPAFLPERYSDQSAASNVVPSSKRTDSAAKSGSTSTVMNTNNPLYVHEETLNSDYVNYK